jgi:hypothetical protein
MYPDIYLKGGKVGVQIHSTLFYIYRKSKGDGTITKRINMHLIKCSNDLRLVVIDVQLDG